MSLVDYVCAYPCKACNDLRKLARRIGSDELKTIRSCIIENCPYDIEQAKNFTAAIRSMDPEDQFTCMIEKDTSTTELMTEFIDSGKRYMIAKLALSFFSSGKHLYGNLIIGKGTTNCNYGRITMTELKRRLNSNTFDLEYFDNALADIYVERGPIIPFRKPIKLSAQTKSDREIDGWQWGPGGELVHEGKQYGETSTFSILGIEMVLATHRLVSPNAFDIKVTFEPFKLDCYFRDILEKEGRP